ncbi:hypothetical protein [Helicobacter himalayensis]|uniref:hypothetical protein n=1 Tax=Helicobacter himalayensis TaxID=1591088 RepID=UPI0008340D2A|nr:hypothetical protein [Helicobacter himalayensis]
MLRNEFLHNIQSDARIELNAFACEKMQFFLSHIDEHKPEDSGLLDSLCLELMKSPKRRIYANDFFITLKECLQKQADFEASVAKIKNFKGTRYEEECLLQKFFFDKRAKELGLQWLEEVEANESYKRA